MSIIKNIMATSYLATQAVPNRGWHFVLFKAVEEKGELFSSYYEPDEADEKVVGEAADFIITLVDFIFVNEERFSLPGTPEEQVRNVHAHFNYCVTRNPVDDVSELDKIDMISNYFSRCQTAMSVDMAFKHLEKPFTNLVRCVNQPDRSIIDYKQYVHECLQAAVQIYYSVYAESLGHDLTRLYNLLSESVDKKITKWKYKAGL